MRRCVQIRVDCGSVSVHYRRNDCCENRSVRRLLPLCLAALFGVTACSEIPRTATNFCRQLEKEMPAIASAPATEEEVNMAVERFKRLARVAPLEIEEHWNALTALMVETSKVDADNQESVQRVVDLAYSTEASATASSEWVVATCGVDISQGMQVTP